MKKLREKQTQFMLNEPLFKGFEVRNCRAKDKKSASFSVRINVIPDDLIYVGAKTRTEIIGYKDPLTGLFVTDSVGEDVPHPYYQFRQEATRYADKELQAFLRRLEQMPADQYEKYGYKPLDALRNELTNYYSDRQDFYADLAKQVNLIVSRKVPKLNDYLVFADDLDWEGHAVTAKLPYDNPKYIELEAHERALVDRFLDEFFDNYNKKTFSWMMGAALLNIPVYDDRVSKLMVVSSTYSGSGKSSLVNGLTNALFTEAYRDIYDDFDQFFVRSNRFASSVLGTKRMNVYSEAAWNADPLSEDHDFTGLNTSAIKAMITEGYVSREVKYETRTIERLGSFHVVLTNHPPVMKPEHEALKRRILSVMIRPTSMVEKARNLNLFGKQKFEDFLTQYAELFAAYFVSEFLSDEQRFMEDSYDSQEYLDELSEAGEAVEEKKQEERGALAALKTKGFLSFLSGLEETLSVDLSDLRQDVQSISAGGGTDALKESIRMDRGTLYINASKNFLLSYVGGHPQLVSKLRRAIQDGYGLPVRRFHMRAFEIPLNEA